jgi:hypothetical protein
MMDILSTPKLQVNDRVFALLTTTVQKFSGEEPYFRNMKMLGHETSIG